MRQSSKVAILFWGLWLAARGAEYYVAPYGSDQNPGTKTRPFRSIQAAADRMVAGDTCFLRGGIYRETVRPKNSGRRGQPIRFIAYPGEVVVLSGTEPIKGQWSVYRGSIWKTAVHKVFVQLFVDGRMMIEARWPNMQFHQLWDRSRWARASKGSRYGRVVDPELAKTGIDWTGALATLNVAHQFLAWTRPVAKHFRYSEVFEYARDLPGITNYADRTKEWEDDRYYLFGKLEALDSPGEWFLDVPSRTLYLWPEDGKCPAAHRVEAKVRDYAFDVENLDYIELHGMHFFAATFRFVNSNYSIVDDCHLMFPTYSRHLTDVLARPEPVATTLMVGSHNRIANSSLAYSATGGFSMQGSDNVLENCLVHDICWNGSLHYVAIAMSAGKDGSRGGPSVVRGNTVFNTGNAAIVFSGQQYIIEYNHVYDGGRACKDVALIHTGGPEIAGSVVRCNWVHGCRTEEGGGLGIRGDDQTRGLSVHHNVVWDTGRDGIIVKGDYNAVYNNTVFEIGTKQRRGNYISLHTEPEPYKWWRKQFPLLKVQNVNSVVFNNAAATITCDRRGTPFPAGPNISHNFQGEHLDLCDPGNLDFRPSQSSPLVDAGKAVAGMVVEFKGKAPDIGAYEHGGEHWKAGHRNQIRFAPDGKRIKIWLAMPPLKPLTISLMSEGASLMAFPNELTFSPDDWMIPRTVTVRARAAGLLRLEGPGLDTVPVAIGK